MGELVARFNPGQNVPGFAVTQVNAGRFVKIVADKTAQGDYSIGHAGNGEHALGVAQADSAAPTLPATAAQRRVAVSRKSVARVAVGGTALGFNVAVQSDANGFAIPQTGGGETLGHTCHAVPANAPFVELELV